MFGAKKNHDDVWTELSTNIGNGFADDNDEDDGSPPWMLPKSLRKGNGDSDGLNMSDMDDDAELIGLGAFAKLLNFQVLSMLEYRKLIQHHAVHSIQHVLKVLKENSALKKFATKLLPFFFQHSRMISGDDVSALLEPGRDLGLDQSKRYLQKQKDYYNAPITLQGTAFTFFITFVDIGMMIAEIIVNNGLVPGTEIIKDDLLGSTTDNRFARLLAKCERQHSGDPWRKENEFNSGMSIMFIYSNMSSHCLTILFSGRTTLAPHYRHVSSCRIHAPDRQHNVATHGGTSD
jgi:hypothetical protein